MVISRILNRAAVATAVTAAIIVSTSACSADRPSSDNLEDGLTASDSVLPIPEQMAGCFAELLLDSDISAETLQAIAERDSTYTGSDEDQDELTDITASVAEKCS